MERSEREFTAGGRGWRAIVARRGPSGHALLYFLPLEGSDVSDDDRRDRRAALDPEDELSALDEDDLRSGLEEATPLTGTERRFRAPDGRLWLAQSVGPVWADDGVAAGLTGVVFTSLEGAGERRDGPGGHVGEMSAAELSEAWRAASGAEDDAPAAGDEAGAEP